MFAWCPSTQTFKLKVLIYLIQHIQFIFLFQVRNNNIVTNQAAIDAWLLRDVTCRNYILATNEQNQKKNLYGLLTAREMWLKIETQYASNAADLENNCLTSLYNFKYDSGTRTDLYHCITNNCLNKLITKSFCYLPFREGHHEPHKWRSCFHKQTKRDWQTNARAPHHQYNTLILTRVLCQSKIKLEYYSSCGKNGYQPNRETKGRRNDYCLLFKASPN